MKDTIQQTINNVKEQKQKIQPIEGTPFALATSNGITKIICGNNLMTFQEFESEEKAIEYINKKHWELICTLIGVIAEKVFTDLKNK